MQQYILYAIIIVGIFTAYMAAINIFKPDRRRIRMQSAGADYLATAATEEKNSLFAAFCQGMAHWAGADEKAQKELAAQMAQAGFQSPHAVSYMMFFKRIVQPVLLVLGALFFLKLLLSPELEGWNKWFTLLSALILIGLGLFGATLYITNCKQRRQTILLRSFPEVLDLLLVCIESGLGLDAALGRVCTEMRATHPVVIGDLDRVRIELTMLSDRVQALQNLADRAEIVPYKALVAALIQTEKFGTSLVDTLRVLSEDQRTTRLLDAENRAARIPVLVTIPLILCILPAFIMVILGPSIVKVINQGGIFGHNVSK
jgi:tight adherence protein C